MKKKSRVRVSKSITLATPAYELVLEIGGKMYTSSGESMLDALSSLPRPAKIVSKAQLFIRSGTKQRMLLLLIPQTKRLFYPLTQQVLAKQFLIGLK